MKSLHLCVIISVVCFWSASLSGELEGRLANGPAFVEVTDVRGYKALVLVPVNTGEAINGKLPAILFLHGIGDRGNDLNLLKQNGFPRILEGDQQFPFIFIMPQCPSSTEWYYTNADNITAMRTFLDDILSRFPIDANRLSITGLSMGGIGSWYFAINLPSRFAALVPVAFRGDGWSPAPAKDIPVWAFHGAKDGVIPLAKAQQLVDQFRAAGGNIKFDPYPNGGHDASTWTVTYNNPDVYDWMLRKRRLTSATPSDDSRMLAPQGLTLDQNFPNPFNPATVIRFGLPDVSTVTLTIYDVVGREVATLVNDQLTPGYHEYTWNADRMAGGAYFYRISATSSSGNRQENFTRVKKLTVQK
jgi:predicted esterase